jgi:23S rRNA-/tRNA-specific pseudouridylate synthase
LFWSLSPLTGRSHPLRYEMFRHGCPLLGDELYGSEEQRKNEIALCHAEIHLETPMSGLNYLTLARA